jgi:hypothetical protein
MFIASAPGVYFTKLCASIENLLAHSVLQKNCYPISPAFWANEICPICTEKFAKLICHLPNAICQKKPSIYVGKIDPRSHLFSMPKSQHLLWVS